MIYKRNIKDLIKAISQSIQSDLPIQQITDNGDGTYSLEMCDTSYLQPGLSVTIGGNGYLVDSIEDDGVTVSGSVAIVQKTMTIPKPFFFGGTILSFQGEMSRINSTAQKTPLVYLFEVIKERIDEDPESAIERTSSLRIFFLTDADFQNWSTDDFHENAIQPMRRLSELFVEVLKEYPGVNQILSYEVINHNKFGTFLDNKGFEKSLITEKLSGCELQIELELRKKVVCQDC